MKSKYNPSYRSYIATMKRKRYEHFMNWIKEIYVGQILYKECGSPVMGRISGKSLTCVIHDEVV